MNNNGFAEERVKLKIVLSNGKTKFIIAQSATPYQGCLLVRFRDKTDRYYPFTSLTFWEVKDQTDYRGMRTEDATWGDTPK